MTKGLLVGCLLVTALLWAACAGESEWEAALKHGGDFTDAQWSTSTCATIQSFINDGYVSAWWSDSANDIRITKRSLDGQTPEGYQIVPILGTHLRHCRG